jgi:hypothetical protein
VTQIVWPFGCVCHAVLAPGVKWTLLADSRDWPVGAATVSMKTSPVNQSLGPAAVSMEFLVICMSFLESIARTLAGRVARRWSSGHSG